MKAPGPNLLSATVILLASFAPQPGSFAAQDQAAELQIQGRPLSEWVEDADRGEIFRPGNGNPALDVLLSTGPKIMTNLADLLMHGVSTHQLAGAALMLGAIAYHNPDAPELPAAVPALASGAERYDPRVRVYAIQGLGAVGKPASNTIPLLIRLTKDEDRSVRMCAVESLGRIGIATPETVSALKNSTSDTDGTVSVSAVQALYKLGQPPTNAISVLIRLTQDEEISVRCAAVDTLGQVGTNSPEAVAALKSALSDESKNSVRPLARQALESLKAGDSARPERKDLVHRMVQVARERFETGRLESADKILQASLEIDPENAEARYYLALVQTAVQRNKNHAELQGR